MSCTRCGCRRCRWNCRFTIASKANPFPLYDKSLTAESVRTQMAATLAALRQPSVDIYYLHAPDIHTPIEETLAAMGWWSAWSAVNELHAAGKFVELGLSNYPSVSVTPLQFLPRTVTTSLASRIWIMPFSRSLQACDRACVSVCANGYAFSGKSCRFGTCATPAAG